MEEKGLSVSMGKTKVMRCRDGAGQVIKSGKYPCGVCHKVVGSNSIKCTSRNAWIHKRCSGISGKLQNVSHYHCRRCLDGNPAPSGMLKEILLGTDEKLECVENFCYLGDMIGAGGGAEEASRARVRCAWAKFRELAPVLTSRGASLKVKGKVYKACVQRVLVYGSEMWPVKMKDMQHLVRTEWMMVRWMCGASLKDKTSSEDLNRRLSVEGVEEVVRRGRLRWFGHLERKGSDDWVSTCRNVEVVGAKSRGRNRKTWGECNRKDFDLLGLKREWAQDRARWKGSIGGNRPTRASMEKWTLNR
jgi:hypothetical protein